jgi:spore maturation protein CgeB
VTYRILFLGCNWFGSCARACSAAFRRLGSHVLDVSEDEFIPQWTNPFLRIFRRGVSPLVHREYNQRIVHLAKTFDPDFLFAFKGGNVWPETLDQIRGLGVKCYNFYPDTSAFTHGRHLPVTLPKYDCIFYTKRFWLEDVQQKISVKRAIFLPHGYDPEVHRRLELRTEEQQIFGHDVSVLAFHTPAKEALLSELLGILPGIDLSIWGRGWKERCRQRTLQAHIQGIELTGDLYAVAIQAAKINLALLSGQVRGASQGDETTTRTFEIPACGGFMIHQRTIELAEVFKEDKEVVCFSTASELARKIQSCLGDGEQRSRIAANGFRRCVPAYAYDERMKKVLTFHAANSGKPN